MNILVCHKAVNVLQKVKILERLSYKIIVANNYADGIQKYKNNKIDFLIIDYKNKSYEKLFLEILAMNLHIKTITVSNDICESCREIGGCEHCLNSFKRRRLLNTFEIKELINVLQNFDEMNCHYYNTFFNIESILDDILKRFINVKYDKEQKIIRLKDKTTFSTQNLVEIVSLLKEHDIKYEVLSEYEVKVISDSRTC